MLIRFKKNMEKIAMGLLSFMPDAKDDVKKLQSTIREYESNPDWHLYLWKEDDDVLGIIGVKISDDNVIIQHISVNPSHRNVGIGKKMIKEVKNLYGKNYVILAEASIQSYFEHCNQLDKTAE